MIMGAEMEKEEETPEKLLEELTAALEKTPDDPDLLYRRAGVLQQMGRYGDAANDLIRLLEKDPDHEAAQQRLALLEEILKFTNLDIFSDPNTHHDPWME